MNRLPFNARGSLPQVKIVHETVDGQRDPPLGAKVTRQELLDRISINPNICFGKPCIKGHRIWVSLVLDWLASGWSVDEILREYELEEADVLACIAYGAEMSRERFVEIPIAQSA